MYALYIYALFIFNKTKIYFPADVLAAAIVGCALVLVREEDGGEPVLLDAVVREELQAQAVALGRDHLQCQL